MKFLHLSDLHIGKRLNGISLFEDQKYILNQIAGIAKESGVDAVVIAGDIYDRSAPSADAVSLFDDFLTQLSELNVPILIISGNHDSPERLAFGGRLMKNIYIYSVFDGSLKRVTVKDVDFYMLPFVRPQTVRRFFDDPELRDYEKMTKLIFKDFKKRGKSVLVMHQFVTSGALRSDTGESVTVGTLDNISVSHFSDFDYVALGHVHIPQRVSDSSNAVYCGSPLKYSCAEAGAEKYAVIVDCGDNMNTEKIPLVPLRDVRRIRGKLEELLNPETYSGTNTSDFLHITLTDEGEIPDAQARLAGVYENVVEIVFEREKDILGAAEIDADFINSKTPQELFAQFFEEQNGIPMNEEQRETVNEIMEELCVR